MKSNVRAWMMRICGVVRRVEDSYHFTYYATLLGRPDEAIRRRVVRLAALDRRVVRA